jgi:quercetin dioxygenase-like cupin family protein
MKIPIKKSLTKVAREGAHGGSGGRQVLFSKVENITKNLEAWTKGFLPVGSNFDWHNHNDVDEFFIVLKGKGYIEYEDGTKYEYDVGDIFYNPAELKHKIVNTDNIENEFFFIRINK